MLNEDRAGTVADLLASLERWQRRAERSEETAEHERELREAMEGFVRAGAGAGVGGGAGLIDAAIVSALARAARVVRADRTYALFWDGPSARVHVWPPPAPPAAASLDVAHVSGPLAQEAAPASGIDAGRLVPGLAAGFVNRAVGEIREGRTVEWPVAAGGAGLGSPGGAGLGSPGDRAPAVRSLLWVPIGAAPLVKGLLGCDASTVEVYWSPPRRAFMNGLAAMLDLVAAR